MCQRVYKVTTKGRRMEIQVYDNAHAPDCDPDNCQCNHWQSVLAVSKTVGLIVAAAIESGDFDRVEILVNGIVNG